MRRSRCQHRRSAATCTSRLLAALLVTVPTLACAGHSPTRAVDEGAGRTAAAAADSPAGPTAAPDQSPPTAVANEQRTAAGRMVDGELVVELEAVEVAWYPRGEDGPRIVTPAFAEVGGAPSVPGPLIRSRAGIPVRVTVHNLLDSPIEVRGLTDRVPGASTPDGTPPDTPAFLFEEPLSVAPGASAVARFTPGAEVSSFYFGRVMPTGGMPGFIPGGIADEGAFLGALVVDPAGAPPHPDERVFVITRWGSPDEPGSLNPSWKMMINGRSWPHTERVDLAVGDTARWRIINTSLVDHPMHLHGFYFDVEATGDTHADTVFARADRREVVTEMMQELSSLRLRWVPERPGNWLFHCHLVRHSGEQQRFQVERDATTAHAGHDQAMDMDGMAGMILGIRVRAPDGIAAQDPPPTRRIDLWTGSRPGVFGDAPELGFVVQHGANPPAADSTVVPGSPLVLTRGEPTQIVVHNRLDFPLSVHWHGLELRSLYDGVGHWSGSPGSVRPPIEPGDSQRVVIAPPRAGTFFYHTHGEPGHELAQGLYGAFLVTEPGQPRDPHADRVFVLGSRGASIDAPPAVNGSEAPPAERFEPGRTYRLRFIHISPDEFKRVRLLRDDQPVSWRPLAKDGADLPAALRTAEPAVAGIGVGEAYDFEWTPERPGIHVLEVRTSFYPSRGGSMTQRVPVAVGEVDPAELERTVRGEAIVALTAEQRGRYVGTFTGPLLAGEGPAEFVMAVWEEEDRLYQSLAPRGAPAEPLYLVPLGDGSFGLGLWEEGRVTRIEESVIIRFADGAERSDRVEIEQDGQPMFRLERAEPFTLSDEELAPFTGLYGGGDLPVDLRVRIDAGELVLSTPGQPDLRLSPIASRRFRPTSADAPPGLFVFEGDADGVTALVWSMPGQPPIRVPRKGDG